MSRSHRTIRHGRARSSRTASASRPRLKAKAASAGTQPTARAVGTSSAGTRRNWRRSRLAGISIPTEVAGVGWGCIPRTSPSRSMVVSGAVTRSQLRHSVWVTWSRGWSSRASANRPARTPHWGSSRTGSWESTKISEKGSVTAWRIPSAACGPACPPSHRATTAWALQGDHCGSSPSPPSARRGGRRRLRRGVHARARTVGRRVPTRCRPGRPSVRSGPGPPGHRG